MLFELVTSYCNGRNTYDPGSIRTRPEELCQSARFQISLLGLLLCASIPAELTQSNGRVSNRALERDTR